MAVAKDELNVIFYLSLSLLAPNGKGKILVNKKILKQFGIQPHIVTVLNINKQRRECEWK